MGEVVAVMLRWKKNPRALRRMSHSIWKPQHQEEDSGESIKNPRMEKLKQFTEEPDGARRTEENDRSGTSILRAAKDSVNLCVSS